MISVNYTRKPCLWALALAVSGTAGFGSQAPAFANEPPPVAAAAPEGEIIFARDVPYGSAIGPRTPAREHTVTTGPTALILSSIAAGLEPIGDDENASIVAGTNSQTAQIGDRVALGMSAVSSMSGSGNSASRLGDIQSAATGGAISQATGAIGSAMDSFRGVLSGLGAGFGDRPGGGPGGGQ